MNKNMRTQKDAPQLNLTIADHDLYQRGPDDVVSAERLDKIAGAFMDMGAGGVAYSVIRTLDYIGLAEMEIQEGIKRHPQQAEKLKSSFRFLAWLDPNLPTDAVYRSHARQLIERVAKEDDLRPGTWAEALTTLSAASLKAPLNQRGMAAMYLAMEHSLGPVSMQYYVAEPYQGAAMELLQSLITKAGKERDVSKLCGLTH